MNIALILAGGIGLRMGEEIPKQFINVYGKPVIIYTLETFQNHPQIDCIYCVCLEGWQDVLKKHCKEFGISKLKGVFTGGSTSQESIRNGIFSMEGLVQSDDIIIIHDGVRPLVDDFVLTDVIAKCKAYGNAVSSMPYNEQIFVVHDKDSVVTDKYIPRETLRRVVTPQAYKYDKLLTSYRMAFDKGVGISPSSYTNTMMTELGEKLHLAAGSDKNIKLTTKDNLEVFKAYLQMQS